MAVWIIEPHEPVIFRDGRPFGPTPGARAKSLPFPFPSTTAGGVRTQAGSDDNGIFDTAKIERVKGISVQGPLLIELTTDDSNKTSETWLVPAPADALLLDAQEKSGLLKRLIPLQLPEGARTDFDHTKPKDLHLVGLEQYDASKPAKKPPLYWRWDFFQNWLLRPDDVSEKTYPFSELGHRGPQSELRVHVSMESGIAKDGALFDTSGLEFTHPGQKQHRLRDAKRLALAINVSEERQGIMHEGLASFGSERRIVSWRKSSNEFPECCEALVETIASNKACRVLLLTPAYFEGEEGYLPTDLLKSRHGVRPQLQATIVQRPQVVSGWDMEKGERRASRRLVPAGSVFFLSLGENKAAIREWVRTIWMQCVSDRPEDCKDGFGLAVLGTWSGDPVLMK